MRFELFLDLRRPYAPWEWGLTVVAIAAAAGTFLAATRPSCSSTESRRADGRKDEGLGDRAVSTVSDCGGPRAADHSDVELLQVDSQEQLAEARQLVVEYADWLGIDLSFQDFDRELAEFPGEYSPPSGGILLARVGEQIAGCVALCRAGEVICEMKRLFVRAAFRGQGIGKRLATAIIDEARKKGYRRMRLDTLSWMTEAITLYESLGFEDIEPYRYNPFKDARFMELVL